MPPKSRGPELGSAEREVTPDRDMDLRLNGAQERRAKGCGRAETIAESATHGLDFNARRVAAHVASFVLYNH